MSDRQAIPVPSAARRRPTVKLEPLAAAKVELYRTMRRADLRKATLARKLGVHAPQVERLLDLRHASRFDQLLEAFEALGKTLEIKVKRAA